MAAVLNVKVVPGASSTKVAGWPGPALKLRVAAPPERGRANAAVVDLLSKVLDVPKRDIEIAAGSTSRNKIVQIEGLSETELQVKLAVLEG